MEITLKRKSIDLPTNVLEKLSAMATRQGKTLKMFMESILTNKAAEENPSPSGDPWFDDQQNMDIVQEGIKEIKQGKGIAMTLPEIKARLGL